MEKLLRKMFDIFQKLEETKIGKFLVIVVFAELSFIALVFVLLPLTIIKFFKKLIFKDRVFFNDS